MNEEREILARSNASSREKLTTVGMNLYSPPDENVRAPLGKYLKTETDQLFFDLAFKLGIEPKPFWPNEAPYAVRLTHDIDRIKMTYQRLSSKFKQKDLRGAFKRCLLI